MLPIDSHPILKVPKNLIQIRYKTGSGKIYPMEIGFGQILSSNVPIDLLATRQACQKGCNLYGRNGGCPPFAPSFTEVCEDNLLIVYAKLLTQYYPEKILNGPFYPRWAFVETFMTTFTNSVGKSIARDLNGYFLSSGNCRSCRPKRCAVKEGKNCRNLYTRTFSLESTGIVVTDLIKQLFNFDLQWWKRSELSYIPGYMVKVIGISTKLFHRNDDVRISLLNIISNCNKIIQE